MRALPVVALGAFGVALGLLSDVHGMASVLCRAGSGMPVGLIIALGGLVVSMLPGPSRQAGPRLLAGVIRTLRARAPGVLSSGAGPRERSFVELAEGVEALVARLEASEQFAGCAAHDLRASLGLVQGQLELALRRERSAAEYRLAIQDALEAARETRALADDLLALGEAGQPRSGERTRFVSVHAAVRGAARVVHQSPKSGRW